MVHHEENHNLEEYLWIAAVDMYTLSRENDIKECNIGYVPIKTQHITPQSCLSWFDKIRANTSFTPLKVLATDQHQHWVTTQSIRSLDNESRK
jgi:hypothetical protein